MLLFQLIQSTLKLKMKLHKHCKNLLTRLCRMMRPRNGIWWSTSGPQLTKNLTLSSKHSRSLWVWSCWQFQSCYSSSGNKTISHNSRPCIIPLDLFWACIALILLLTLRTFSWLLGDGSSSSVEGKSFVLFRLLLASSCN